MPRARPTRRFSVAALQHATAKNRINAAAQDRLILHIPVRLVMRHYGMSTANAKAAVELAWKFAKARGAEVREKDLRERDRLVASLRKAERKYPGIAAQSLVTENIDRTADFHKVSRAWVYNVRKKVELLAGFENKSAQLVATFAASNAFAPTQRECFLSRIGSRDGSTVHH